MCNLVPELASRLSLYAVRLVAAYPSSVPHIALQHSLVQYRTLRSLGCRTCSRGSRVEVRLGSKGSRVYIGSI
eukprot:1338539-Rhodomonas_salina.2